MMHKSMMGRGVRSDGAKTLADVIDRLVKAGVEPEDYPPGVTMEGIIESMHVNAVAEPVAFVNHLPESWVTTCPHCERTIGITLKGNGK